jgi:hypothetical protein
MRRWLNILWNRIVVSDVPAEMDKCLDCGKVECLEAEYQACAARKQRQADIENAPPASVGGDPSSRDQEVGLDRRSSAESAGGRSGAP